MQALSQLSYTPQKSLLFHTSNNKAYTLITVSYTHLTLPTKRIV